VRESELQLALLTRDWLRRIDLPSYKYWWVGEEVFRRFTPSLSRACPESSKAYAPATLLA